MRNMFAQILGRSPVGPIEKHIDEVNKAALALQSMSDAAQQADWDQALKNREEIESINVAANELRRELRLSLPSTFLMPVAREDLLELLDGQDKILRRINDVAGLIFGRRIQLPQPLSDTFQQLISCTVEAVGQTRQSVKELDELFEAGFRGREEGRDLVDGHADVGIDHWSGKGCSDLCRRLAPCPKRGALGL